MHVMISADEIKSETANDEILCLIIKFVHQGWPKSISSKLKPCFKVHNKLSVCNDCLVRLDCIICPGSLGG